MLVSHVSDRLCQRERKRPWLVIWLEHECILQPIARGSGVQSFTSYRTFAYCSLEVAPARLPAAAVTCVW